MAESQQRVLLVDDSATMRGYVTAALESAGGFAVTQAESGFHALKMLPRGHFDLIITDINMPDINGLELVRFVRDSEQHKTVPLLIISTDGRDIDRDRGIRLGANAYLTKPFAREALLAAVNQLLHLA